MRDEAFFQTLGRHIATLRRQAGLAHVELAARVGLKQQALATYENATRRLPASVILPTAAIIEVPVERRLGLEAPSRKRGPAPKLQQQFEAISTPPKGEQKFFTQMIERFLNESTVQS